MSSAKQEGRATSAVVQGGIAMSSVDSEGGATSKVEPGVATSRVEQGDRVMPMSRP